MNELEKDILNAIEKGTLKEFLAMFTTEFIDLAFKIALEGLSKKIKLIEVDTENEVNYKTISFNKKNVLLFSKDIIEEYNNYYSILFRKFN